jgi:hypothetical protein
MTTKKTSGKSELEELLSGKNMDGARLALAEQLNRLLRDKADGGSAGKAPEKVVRESFSLPESDYRLIGELQERALDLRLRISKSELFRAGLRALAQMKDEQLKEIFAEVEKLKPGRRKES